MSAPFQEERALLGKEQREPRQVRPPGVHLRFGEVRVDGDRREHVGADALRHIEAGLALPSAGWSGAGMPPPAVTDGRIDRPTPERELGQVGQQARAAGLRDGVLRAGRRPAVGLRGVPECAAAR